MIIEEIKNIKSNPKDIRNFSLVFLAVSLIAAWYFRGQGNRPVYLLIVAGLFALGAVFTPKILVPLQKAWMTIAIVLGNIMSTVILTLLYYAVVTPIGGLVRISGKDFLGLKPRSELQSYWFKRQPEAGKSNYYHRQF